MSSAPAMYAANVRKVYLYQGSTNLMLFMPVWIVFMQTDRHLSLTQVTAMLGFSWFVSAVAEVPTGAVADTLGRRFSLILGTVLVAVGTALVAVLTGYWMILAAYLLWSVGLALQSGSDLALLYDSLQLAGREQDYGQVAGRSFSIILLAQGVSSVAGGLLAGIALNLPLLATSVCTVVGLFFALSLKEPPVERVGRPSYTRTLREAAGLVRRRRGLLPLMLFSATLGVVPWVLLFVLFQPYLDGRGVPIAWFGALFLVLRLAGVAGSRLGPRLIPPEARQRWLTVVPLVFCVLFVAMAVVPPWAVVFVLMFVVGFLQGCVRPALSDLLNKRLEGSVRATVLSLQSLLLTLLIAVFQPAAGWISDRTSPTGVFVMLAGVSLVAALLRELWRRSERAGAGAPAAAPVVSSP